MAHVKSFLVIKIEWLTLTARVDAVSFILDSVGALVVTVGAILTILPYAVLCCLSVSLSLHLSVSLDISRVSSKCCDGQSRGLFAL